APLAAGGGPRHGRTRRRLRGHRMTAPDDDASEVRESAWGRALLAGGIVVAVLLPTWLLASAFLVQLDPALNGFDAVAMGRSDRPVHDRPTLEIWTIGAVRGAVAVGLLAPLAFGGLLLSRLVGIWRHRRDRRDRERYDAL